MKYEVEIATTYYDVAEVDADDEQQARARVEAGLGLLRPGITVSDAAVGEVRPLIEAVAARLDGCT